MIRYSLVIAHEGDRISDDTVITVGGDEFRAINEKDLRNALSGTQIISIAEENDTLIFHLTEGITLDISYSPARIPAFTRGTFDDIFVAIKFDERIRSGIFRLNLISNNERVRARVVEERLRSLRQLYAITLLIDRGEADHLVDFLKIDADGDIEDILEDESCLHIQAAGPGSWWVAVLSGIRSSSRATLTGLSLFYGSGRALFLERLRTENELAKMQVEEQKDRRIILLAKAISNIKDPVGKEAVRKRLTHEIEAANPFLGKPIAEKLLKDIDTMGRDDIPRLQGRSGSS